MILGCVYILSNSLKSRPHRQILTGHTSHLSSPMETNANLPDATKTSPADWQYISEGGATIVFSYIGTSNSDLDGMVLRLRKATSVQPAELLDIHGRVDDPDDPSIAFQHECMDRLIPPVHLPRLEPVRVSPDWLKEFERYHTHERPAERQEQGGIDLTKTKGVIATDLVGGRGIAVEIKVRSFQASLQLVFAQQGRI